MALSINNITTGAKKSKGAVDKDKPGNSDADDNPNPLGSIGGEMGALMKVER